MVSGSRKSQGRSSRFSSAASQTSSCGHQPFQLFVPVEDNQESCRLRGREVLFDHQKPLTV